MNSTLFLEYYNYNDDKFDVKDYFSDSNSYIEALQKYSTQESNFMNVSEKKNNTIQYAKCDCKLYDENNEDLTIDKLVGFYNTNEMIMLVVELKLDTEDEEFDSELNGWYNEHKELDKIKNIEEDKRFLLEPKRDIKMIFNNLKNKETYCTLSNTTILEKMDNEHYIIIVDKVIFTKSF